jgi:hypothetical protein
MAYMRTLLKSFVILLYIVSFGGNASAQGQFVDVGVNIGVTDRLSGVNPNSQDRWGYYFVKDFDADRTSPFLLKLGRTPDL